MASSNDNVFNFSDKSPKNKCGFVENDNGFQITKTRCRNLKKVSSLKILSSKISMAIMPIFIVSLNDDMKKITAGWNVALVITEMDDNVVKGKIAMCFKDDNKSWIAGKFEAARCNN
ncbi:MAG: hypothetical protein MZV64_58360 [Ignavibacteriales bacterium]|nr:hypothetical protein [Ignavibacteriales bacterium]